MQIINETYDNYSPLYPIDNFCPIDKALYIDIETTGLSKETTSLYLIGCGYYDKTSFKIKLFFADSPNEELELLNQFIAFSQEFTHLIHFNGTKFDIPYLKYKANKYNIQDPFVNLIQIDVYQMSKPLRYLLFPTSMRQKCIEEFLSISRDDQYNGGELISVYHSYVSTRSLDDFDKLITHNREDILGMHKIMPILYYLDIKSSPLQYITHHINSYDDYYGNTQKELIIEYKCDVFFPKSFTSKTTTLYLKADAENRTFTFRLPIYETEMKLYFDNYKDYYYLPADDSCIHKSVAMGLNKGEYKKATKETCYRKMYGSFIKQPSNQFTPVFKTSYKDKANYFLLSDSISNDDYNIFGTSLVNVFFTIKGLK